MIRFQRSVWAALIGVALIAAGCGGQRNTQQTSNETPSATNPASEVSVAQVELGRGVDNEKRVTERVDTFAPHDVIYASVITNGSSPGTTLKARWTYEDGQVVEETEQAIAPNGPSATEFHISKPDGWPAGKYTVEVFVDGQPVKKESFEVKST
jgi:hypothetical protein